MDEMKRRIWLVTCLGLALRGVDMGRAFFPWMRRVLARDFDEKVRVFWVGNNQCEPRGLGNV